MFSSPSSVFKLVGKTGIDASGNKYVGVIMDYVEHMRLTKPNPAFHLWFLFVTYLKPNTILNVLMCLILHLLNTVFLAENFGYCSWHEMS